MDGNEQFYEFLGRIVSCVPKDTLALREASAKIISMWIKSKFEYPNDILDRFVYIESSIEQSIHDYVDETSRKNELNEAYKFHITAFMEAIKDLQDNMRP